MRLLITLLLLLSACGRPYHSTSGIDTEFYMDNVPHGWNHWRSNCDGLLFASLTQVALNEDAYITEAEVEPGRFQRLPPNLLKQAGCSTTISRDMMVGLLFYIWHFHRLDMAERVYKYGYSHGWIYGYPASDISHALMTPNLVSWLARIIFALGGADHTERFLPSIYTDFSGNFPTHLSILQILSEAEIAGHISIADLLYLKLVVKGNPGNALYQAILHKFTDGDQSSALRLLGIWPEGRLPEDSDWCEEWRVQRRDGDIGLLPCQGTEVHSGGDFLFVAGIIVGYV